MMVKENINRSFLLDFLKGIAIIAVILYHSGLFTYGYLGVEIFLIVGGYLTTKTLCIFKQCNEDEDDVSFSQNHNSKRKYPRQTIIL
jgi:peptidoglycan/LPS O-acetylase OafA/YrhL